METSRSASGSRAQRWKAGLERRRWFVLARDTVREFMDDKAPRLSAALSYYTLFSLAPLLVIALAVAGFFFGAEASQGQLMGTLSGLLGPTGAQAVEDMIANARTPGAGVVATVVGVVALLVGAGGVFGQLQQAMDTIWDVERKNGRGVMGFLKDRFFSFAMVLGVGFLLLVSLLLTAMLTLMGGLVTDALPGGALLWQVVNFLVGLAVTTLLFGLLFKVVPDVDAAWRDVMLGGLFTALLFTLGKHLIGFYLGQGAVASSYGAAGSLVVVLLWVYYSAIILFLGAEFTQVYANRYGSGFQPDEDVVALPEAEEKSGGRARGRSGT